MSPSRTARPMLLALALAALVLAIARPAAAAPGDLDPTFGTGGKARLTFQHGHDYCYALATQSDGKFLAAGQSQSGGAVGFSLVRYLTNGTPDLAFGTKGHVVTEFPEGAAQAFGVGVLADGKIVVVGQILSSVAIARYLPGGGLDPSFGNDGTTVVNVDAASVRGMALQPDGKVVVVGQVNTGTSDLYVARFTTAGTRDSSFNANGVRTVSINTSDEAAAVTVQFDNKLVVAATSTVSGDHTNISVLRFTTAGALDATFDGDGIRTADLPNVALYANAITLQNSDTTPTKIVVAGSAIDELSDMSRFFIARFGADGAPDLSLGTMGVRRYAETEGLAAATAVRVIYNGSTPSRLVAAGYLHLATEPAGGTDFALIKTQLNGTLDTAFSGDGLVTTPFAAGQSYASAMLLPNSGGIVLGGTCDGASDRDYALARYVLASGALDATWDGDGLRTDDVGSAGWTTAAAALQADGRIIVAGSHPLGTVASALSVVRLLADGSRDSTFDGDGLAQWLPLGLRATPYGVVVQPDGRIVVAGTVESGGWRDLVVARFLTGGAPDTSFSHDGVVITSVSAQNDEARALLLQPDGRLVLVGWTEITGEPSHLLAVRYLGNGSLDTTFGSGGTFVDANNTIDATAYAAALQPDGCIVAAGDIFSTVVVQPTNVLVARLLPNGTLDTSFDGDGRAEVGGVPSSEVARAVTVLPDARVLVSGAAFTVSGAYAFTARLLPGGAMDRAFGAGGTLLSGYRGFTWALAMLPSGRCLAAGGITSPVPGDATSDFMVQDIQPNGTLYPPYAGGGVLALEIVPHAEDVARALLLDASSRAILVGQSNGQLAVARLMADLLPVSVEPGNAMAAPLALSAAWPNPAVDHARLRLRIASTQQVSAHVYDVSGRLVRTLISARALAAGEHAIEWDGRDAQGAAVRGGVYLLSVRAAGRTETRRVALLR